MTERQRLPNRRLHIGQTFDHGGVEYVLGAGCFPDGRPAEMFLATRRIGTAADTAIRDASIAASLALQYGCPVEVLRGAVTRDADGRPSGALGVALDMLGEA
jgi:ribonucleoside-diphosphate reductase alpha chain